MQSKITNKIQWGETLNPLNDFSASIDSTSNLKDVFRKVDKLGDLWDSGQADASLIRYIPGLSNVSRQGKIFNIVKKKRHTQHQHWPIKKHLSYLNTFTNYSNMCIVLPITIKKATNKAQNFDVVTVNNIFCHLLKKNQCQTLSRRFKIFLPTNNKLKSISMQLDN